MCRRPGRRAAALPRSQGVKLGENVGMTKTICRSTTCWPGGCWRRDDSVVGRCQRRAHGCRGGARREDIHFIKRECIYEYAPVYELCDKTGKVRRMDTDRGTPDVPNVIFRLVGARTGRIVIGQGGDSRDRESWPRRGRSGPPSQYLGVLGRPGEKVAQAHLPHLGPCPGKRGISRSGSP